MGVRELGALGGLAILLAACGGQPAAAPTAETSNPPPAATPSATRAATAVAPSASLTPAAAATPTAETAAASTVYVANTDGQGVYVRKTPVMADRVRAYPDGTPLKIVGDDVDGDGQHWHHVTAPDGVEGYVPAMYTTNTPP